MHYLFLILLILFVIWFVYPQTYQNDMYTDTDYERRYGWEGPLWGPRNSF